MKLTTVLAGFCVLILLSCAEKRSEMSMSDEVSASSSQTESKDAAVPTESSGYAFAAGSSSTGNNKNSNAFISSSAAVEKNKDSTRKFIRTAELRFRVKNVLDATSSIEETTKRFGGFVSYTNLSSTVNNVYSTEISSDSSLETTNYTVENNITLRVPNTKLDTTLKTIALTIDFLDYRIIKADDVALQLAANDLTQKRAAKNRQRVTRSINNSGTQLIENVIAEDVVFNREEQSDNAKIANLSLKDQIDFSTVNVIIYQKKTAKQELVANERNIKAYEPGFGSKIIEAIKSGWYMLEAIILGLIHLWPLILLFAGGYFVYRIIKGKK